MPRPNMPIEPIACNCGFTIPPGRQERRWFQHLYESHPETWAQVPESALKERLAVVFNGELERKSARHANVGRKRRERN